MGSVDIVLPSRDSAQIVNPQIDTTKIWTILFTPLSVLVKKSKNRRNGNQIFPFFI